MFSDIHQQQYKDPRKPAGMAILLLALTIGGAAIEEILPYYGVSSNGRSIVIAILFMASIVYSCIVVYRSWSILNPELQAVSPMMAGVLLVVPFFNLYWVFFALKRLAAEKKSKDGIPWLQKIDPRALALSTAILFDVMFVTHWIVFNCGYLSIPEPIFLVNFRLLVTCVSFLVYGLFISDVAFTANSHREAPLASPLVKPQHEFLGLIGLFAATLSFAFAVFVFPHIHSRQTHTSAYGDPNVVPQVPNPYDDNQRQQEILQNIKRAQLGERLQWQGPPLNANDRAFRSSLEDQARQSQQIRQDLQALQRR